MKKRMEDFIGKISSYIDGHQIYSDLTYSFTFAVVWSLVLLFFLYMIYWMAV